MKASPVRFLRLKADIDIEKAIEAIGISKRMFYKVELGYWFPSEKVICKMSELHDCSIDDIYKALGISRDTNDYLN